MLSSFLEQFQLLTARLSDEHSGPMPKVEASSKNLRRFSKCNIQFQICFLSLYLVIYLFHMESLVLQSGLSPPVSVEPRPSVQGNFLNDPRFCGQSKTTLRNKTTKEAL